MEDQEFQELEASVLSAINDSQHTYRTIRGIAKETNQQESLISSIIYKSDKIIKSRKRNRRREPLFTTSDKVKNMSGFRQWKSAFTGSI